MDQTSDQSERDLGVASLQREFPHYKRRLFFLLETDATFPKKCTVYGAALKAGKITSQKPEVLRQFQLIAAETEMEIADILKEAREPAFRCRNTE